MSAPGLDIILVGVGGAAARFVAHSAAGHRGMRALVFDCDAATRDIAGDAEFVEIGAARLDGRSSGGDAVKARTAAQDDAAAIRDAVSGARLAVVAASLGGGFASGALPEILKTMRDAGVIFFSAFVEIFTTFSQPTAIYHVLHQSKALHTSELIFCGFFSWVL